MHKALKICSVVLALSVSGIAVTIEALNMRAGGVLPAHEYRNGDPAEGLATWRYNPLTTEMNWLRFRGPRAADGTPLARPLSPDERSQMTREIAAARAQNTLRSVVSTAGLLQYLLVPTLFIFTLANWRAKSGALWVAPQLVVIACAVSLMFYRGYFASLGW